MVSRPPRQTGDILKVLDAITGLRGDTQGLRDDIQAGHMRSDELAKRVSRLEAVLETISSEVAKVDQKRQNTADELIASQRNAYREFDHKLTDVSDKLELHDNEIVRSVAEGATTGAVKGVTGEAVERSSDNRKLALAGLAAGGITLAVTVGTWISKGIGLLLLMAKVKVGSGD